MKKTYILTTIALLAIAIAGCKKGFLDQEVNPNTPSQAAPQNVLAASESAMVNVNDGTTYGSFSYWMGYYSPSGSVVPTGTTESYTFTNANFNVFNTYFGNITNFTYLINQEAKNPALANFAAISKILIAWDYQALVDNYNDVPYSQAENSAVYLFPAYDKGPAIYADLPLQLDAAIALIAANNNSAGVPNTGVTNPGTTDIIFGGNMEKWRRFANTLKLRIAIRQSNLYATVKAGLITELAKTIHSTADLLDDVTFATANPGYLYSDANGGQQSPYYKSYGFTAAGAESGNHQNNRGNAFFINFLVNTISDTLRLKALYLPANTKAETAAAAAAGKPIPPAPNNVDHFLGNTFGSDATYNPNPNISALGNGILGGATPAAASVAPAPVLTGAEACFLISEAIVEGLIPGGVDGGAGTAQDYYQRGITANFVALNVSDPNPGNKTPAAAPLNATAAAAQYYNQPVVNVSWAASVASGPVTPQAGKPQTQVTDPRVRAIIYQKYVALFGIGTFEAYCEYRRTGFPDISAARSAKAGSLGTGPVPNRIYFPSTEQSNNLINYNLEPAVQPFVSTIFWAINVNP